MSDANLPWSEPRMPGASLDRGMTWLKARERPLLAAAVAVQAAVLLSMAATHAATLWFGETVLVRVVPVDPRDLFRGDYVVLSYEFSRVPDEGIEGIAGSAVRTDGFLDFQEHVGRTVYVSLVPEPDGKHLKRAKMSIHKPAKGPFLRGRIAGWDRIEYGIEAFYLQEGRGLDYEKAVQNKRLSAELAVTADGTAALRALHIADSPPEAAADPGAAGNVTAEGTANTSP